MAQDKKDNDNELPWQQGDYVYDIARDVEGCIGLIKPESWVNGNGIVVVDTKAHLLEGLSKEEYHKKYGKDCRYGMSVEEALKRLKKTDTKDLV